jgi:hypothetical protein
MSDNKIPCEECIVLAACKARYLDITSDSNHPAMDLYDILIRCKIITEANALEDFDLTLIRVYDEILPLVYNLFTGISVSDFQRSPI